MNIIILIRKFSKKIYKNFISLIFLTFYKKPILSKKKLDISEFSKKKIILNGKNYFAYKIIKGRIYTDNNNNAAYISKNNFLLEPSYQYQNRKNSLSSYNSNIKNNFSLKNGTPKIIKTENKNVLSILSGGASRENFSHWFLDTIPRIYLFKKAFKKNKIEKLIVPSCKYRYQSESLKLLGFHGKKIISAEKYKHIKTKTLFATSHPSNYRPVSVPKWNINFIRSCFINRGNKRNKFFDRIYIDRDQTKYIDFENLEKFKTYRVILNDDELKKILINYGFKIIKPETLDFENQISLYRNAKVIFSLFGAAMYLISLCRSKTKIIEVRPKKASDEFKKISNLCKLDHYQIKVNPLINPGKYKQQGLLKCPINEVEKLFKKIKIKKI